MGGSNRTAILNALTTLWRATRSGDGASHPPHSPETIEFWDSFYGSMDAGKQVATTSFDEIPHRTDVVLSNIDEYYRNSLWAYGFGQDLLVDNLEFAAVVFTNYTFPADHTWNGKTIARKGTRFLIGSPIYVAQIAPSGS